MKSALYVNTCVEFGFRSLECVFFSILFKGGFSTVIIYF